MITPGWIALTMVEDYLRAAIIVLMTALTFGGTKILQRFVILYGRNQHPTAAPFGRSRPQWNPVTPRAHPAVPPPGDVAQSSRT